MTNAPRGLQVRSYFDVEAEVLYQKFRMIEKLLPSATSSGSSHAAEEGRHIESLLRDFLNRHLPTDLHAYSGFILRPSTKTGAFDLARLHESEGDQHSTQLDIIVFDRQRYPIYEQFEEFAIVPPEGVVGVVSVKKRLYNKNLRPELNALRRAAAALCDNPGERGPHLGLFAFTSAENYTASKWGTVIADALTNELAEQPFNHLVNEITIMDQLVAFKWVPPSEKRGNARYTRCDVHDSAQKHLSVQRVLQSIMSVYYHRIDLKRPGFTSFLKGSFRDGPLIVELPYINT
jgi:hypothetical protein